MAPARNLRSKPETSCLGNWISLLFLLNYIAHTECNCTTWWINLELLEVCVYSLGADLCNKIGNHAAKYNVCDKIGSPPVCAPHQCGCPPPTSVGAPPHQCGCPPHQCGCPPHQCGCPPTSVGAPPRLSLLDPPLTGM